ncbi:hypothetical protein AC629_02060 [Bradyrhizobium sp. NAS80.1]|nr:hypothetical protein AC629_02060 [Bradyrhizobium sp. NAS80.1]
MAPVSAIPGMIARADSIRAAMVLRMASLIEEWWMSMAEVIGVTPGFVNCGLRRQSDPMD